MAIEKITRDKSPLVDDAVKHKKKGGAKNPFCIERRFVGKLPDHCLWFLYEKQVDWHVFRRYATEFCREKALAQLQRRDKHEWRKYEYRNG